jgi:hypothetical protein
MQGLRSPQRGEPMQARVVDARSMAYTPKGTSFTGNVRLDGKASCSVSTSIAVNGLPKSAPLPTKKMPKLPQVTRITHKDDRKIDINAV